MKKQVFCFILSFLFVINLMGCSKEQKENIPIQAEFTDKEWLFYNEVTAEHLCLNLGSDGTFSYHCQCGEPVGSSDLYDKYNYDKETGIITLFSSSDNATDQVEVLEYNEHHLMIRIDEKVKDFTMCEMDTFSNFWSFEGEAYLSGYNCRCTIIDMEDGKIVCGPIEYDPEGINEDGPFEEYEITDDVEISELTVKSFNSIQGDQEYEEFYNVEYKDFSQEDEQLLEDSGAGGAFLWFDDEMKVEKIVFHGETSVTADRGNGMYDAAHLNEDGSVIYLMTKEQYEKYWK